MDEYYGFHYWDNQHNNKKAQTFLPVGQIDLEGLLAEIADYLPTEDNFLAQYGYIKELSMYDGKVGKTAPAKIGHEKYQAFIFKRKDDVILKHEGFYTLNGVQIDVPLSIYDISIIEL